MENENQEPIGVPEKSVEEKKPESWKDILRFIAIAIIIVVPFRIFVAQPFIVSGASMLPNFHDHDYLIVDKLSYFLHEPHRGDVVIFRYPKDTTKFFIKRIIGLPNETVIINSSGVTIKNVEHPDGFALSEDFVTHMPTGYGHMDKKLDADSYFVLGDNRPASSDSRAWGVLPRKNITGRAFLRLFPFSDIDIVPGEHHY